MRRFFEPSHPLVTPSELVTGFTGRNAGELALPGRAVILFDAGGLSRLLRKVPSVRVEPWASFHAIWRVPEKETVLTRSYFGGPNIAACVEELGAFGVREFIVLGYRGAIQPSIKVGDILSVRAALREDGVSHHYLGHGKALVSSHWFDDWRPLLEKRGFKESVIWSCDAIYRETAEKAKRYALKGISAVEMEVASLYAVAEHHGYKALALVVVSDELHGGGWRTGFHSTRLRDGTERLLNFAAGELIR